jgi:hypothetical protein
MLSFAQAHIGEINPFFLENPLSLFSLAGTHKAETTRGRAPYGNCIFFQLVDLTCAGDMINSKIMTFAEERVYPSATFDLYITPEDLLALWGPGTFISSQSPRPDVISSSDWLSGIAIRSGVIYKPSTKSSEMHWKSGPADIVTEGAAFELKLRTKMVIGAILVDQDCPTEPGPGNTVSRKSLSSDLKELGTWRAKCDTRQMQIGVQGGQFVNAMANMTLIKTDARTPKKKGLEHIDLDFLDQPWGLLVSVCTGVAQRVALREVVAEVISPIMDAWMEKTPEWQTLISTSGGLFEELKKPTFRDWFNVLASDAQHASNRSIGHVLDMIHWTGVDDDGKLVMACPQYGDSGACIRVPLKASRAFSWILKDTERTATFACLTNMCFNDERRLDRCRKKHHPQWLNHISALVTSVCQYQWLGADDWAKLPREDLQDGSMYWIGTGHDKRRVTIDVQPGFPARLAIPDNSTPWRFFRRAWERIERIRQTPHIELRERRLMAEDHARDVVIVREQAK